MHFRELALGWVVVGVVLVGSTGLLSGQEVEQNLEIAVAIDLFDSLSGSGQHESEAALARVWMHQLEGELDVKDPRTLDLLSAIGRAFLKKGRLHAALACFEKQTQLSMHMLGTADPATSTAQNNLALTVYYLGDLQRARDLQQEVVEKRSQLLGLDHPRTLTAKVNLAATLHDLGDLKAAQNYLKEVLATRRQALGEEHPDTLNVKANLAETYRTAGDLLLARMYQEEVLAVRTGIFGEEHPSTLMTKANLAATLGALGFLTESRDRLEEVLEVRSRILGREHPDTLTVRSNLAGTLAELGNFQEAREHKEEVLAIFSRVLGANHSRTLAAKGNLAVTFREIGEYKLAKQFQEEVLAVLVQSLGDEHPQTLRAKANLGATLFAMGDLETAREYYQEVVAVLENTLGRENPDTLAIKVYLAVTLRKLGDFASAREHFENVLAAYDRIFDKGHPATLNTRSNLAEVLRAQGALGVAKERYQKLIDLLEQTFGMEHPETLKAKVNLAAIHHQMDDYKLAKGHLEEVVESFTRMHGSDHPDTLAAEANLAVTLKELGHLGVAREREERILDVRSRILGEEHPETLKTKANLAGTLARSEDWLAARRLYQEVISLRERISGEGYCPNTQEEAETFFGLAITLRRLGLLEESYSSFLRGLDALEAQVFRVDFSEDRKSSFREGFANAYRESLQIALETGRREDALELNERYRTWSLLNLIRWSHPASGLPIPEELRIELAKIARRYDWLTRQNDASYPSPDPVLLEEQAQLRRRREVIQGKIIDMRREAEGISEPPTLDDICIALDPGTVLLAYSIGQDEGHLFVLTHEHGLEVHPVETKAETLWLQAKRLRQIDQDKESSSPEARRSLAQWLYGELLSHAADRIESAERVVVLPDGPLYYLPFPALTRPAQDDPRGWQYLAEWKPFHIVQSATIYAELQAKRSERSNASNQHAWQWVGFGDPIYPKDTKKKETKPASDKPASGKRSAAVLRSLEERGIWRQVDLPSTGHEIRAIAEQFPEGQAKKFLGPDANEDRVREMLASARIVHLAAHGVDDPDYPLDSLIALSLLESDELEHNGLLQAWEIIDQLELNADLVVLSACETALGPNRGGEGLISLSRAFQIAGARSVLASLWSVNDLSTSELMIRFYRHFLAGETKDRALQLAQIELIRGPVEIVNENGETETHDFSAPYHWAAFQLIGDWK